MRGIAVQVQVQVQVQDWRTVRSALGLADAELQQIYRGFDADRLTRILALE
ncbi:hypothetical protein [Rathayibacter sp. AY1E9]|uniref:hypothetical protein n=1 Tax=Rathayibacter sp. AY1E9 TaxID=2080556 RepID=UPI0015E1D65B|nr:hypothetical protein [Rathayibacter sp. AY1E9]